MEQNPNSPYIEIPTTNFSMGFKFGAAVTEVVRHDSDAARLVTNMSLGPRLVINRGERADQKAHQVIIFLTDLTFIRKEYGSIKVLPQNVASGWR